jgi:O-antigen/teichoic acid export membrane protein
MTARGVVADSLRFALSQYLSRAVILARGLVAAAALGPAGFGAWNALVLILDYGSYASLGALYGLDLELPPAVASRDEPRAVRALRGAWGLTLAGGALFAVVVVAYLAAGTWLAVTGWGWGPPLLMLAAAFVQLAFHYHAAALRARGDFAAVSAAVSLQALIGGGIGLLAVWRAGVWGLLWGWLIGGVAALVRLRRSDGRPPLQPASPVQGVPLAIAGFPLFAYFALTLVLRSLDRIALVRFGGNAALGRYSIGLIAAGLVLYPPEAVAAVLFPRLAAAAEGARDAARTRQETMRAQRALALLLPPAVALGAIWAEPLVAAVLPAFLPGVPALRILAIGALLMAGATLPGYALLGLGKGLRTLPWAAAAVVVAGLLIFSVAAAQPNATGVAIAAAAGQGCFSVLVLVLGARELALGAERRALVLATLVPAAWAILPTALLLAWGGSGWMAATWRSLALGATYAPLLWALGRALGLFKLVLVRRTA